MDVTVDSRRETEKRATFSGGARAEPPSISLVIPAYNEQDVIGKAIREADEALAQVTDDYEIIVVDDGSRDATRQRAESEAGERRRVRVIAHGTNRGYGAALRSGFQSATKSCVAFTDADCQFDLRELNRLTLLINSYDIVCGYRIDRQDHWLRSVYSRTYNAIVRVLLGTRVRDCDCALKLFRRETLDALSITTDGFLVNAELLSRASLQGKTVVEVGVSHRPRAGGESKVSPLHVIPVLLALIRFWWAIVMFPAASCASAAGSPVSVEGDSWNVSKTLGATLSLSLLAGLMLFGNLSYPFFEPDESRYAQIALEMVETGDYLVPRLQGEPYLDKPPLLYWVTATSFLALGKSEFAARFPNAIAAMLTVIVTSLLGGRLLGARSAYLASLMLFLCLGFVLAGRFLIMDGLLTLFTTIGLLASFLAIADRRAVSPWWWLTGAVATGLGMMTKGPVALLLILPPLVAYHWLQRMSVLRARHWLAFAVIVVTITCPWFIVIAWQRDEFAAYFLWEHHVLRFFTAYNHVQPFWYYLPVLLIGMFPSSLLAGPVLGFLAGRSGAVRDQRTRELGAVALAGVWIIVFFSLSRCKLPTYVLPAVPFFCLVQGRMVAGWMHHSFHFPTWDSWVARIPLEATTLAMIAGAIIAITDWCLQADGAMDAVPNLVVIAATAGFLAYRMIRRRAWPAHIASWGVAAATCLLIIAFAFQSLVPELAEYRSINANAARLQYTMGGSQVPVVFLDWRSDGSSFYLRPDLVRRWSVEDIPSIQQFATEHPQFLVVADQPDADALRAELDHGVTIDRSRGARGRLYLFSAIAGSNGPSATRFSSPMRPSKLR